MVSSERRAGTYHELWILVHVRHHASILSDVRNEVKRRNHVTREY